MSPSLSPWSPLSAPRLAGSSPKLGLREKVGSAARRLEERAPGAPREFRGAPRPWRTRAGPWPAGERGAHPLAPPWTAVTPPAPGGLGCSSGATRRAAWTRPPCLGAVLPSTAGQPPPDPAMGLHYPFPRVPGVQRPPTVPNSKKPPELLYLPGPLPRSASEYSRPKARGAAASLGSWPGSLNLLFSSEPPERLTVEIGCNVAYHPGFAGACCSAFCPAPCARSGLRAPPLLDAGPGERPVEL